MELPRVTGQGCLLFDEQLTCPGDPEKSDRVLALRGPTVGGRRQGALQREVPVQGVSKVRSTVCTSARAAVYTLPASVPGPHEDAAVASCLLQSGSRGLG